MSITEVKYFWVKFWPEAPWELVKFWTRYKRQYLKGLDWGSEHELDRFTNKNYELGQEIFPPSTEGTVKVTNEI